MWSGTENGACGVRKPHQHSLEFSTASWLAPRAPSHGHSTAGELIPPRSVLRYKEILPKKKPKQLNNCTFKKKKKKVTQFCKASLIRQGILDDMHSLEIKIMFTERALINASGQKPLASPVKRSIWQNDELQSQYLTEGKQRLIKWEELLDTQQHSPGLPSCSCLHCWGTS